MRPRDLRVRAAALSTTLVVLIVALVGQGALAAEQGQLEVASEPPDVADQAVLCDGTQSMTTDPPSVDRIARLNGRWIRLPRAPITGRFDHSAVWTGDEVLIWGGSAERSPGDHRYIQPADGAAFDPSTGSWRRIPRAPIKGRDGHSAIWTGTEMIVWGGTRGTRVMRDGAAYDPATGRWRRITSPDPGAERYRHRAVWTGSEMVVWSGWAAYGSEDRPTLEGLRYDPQADTWQAMATSPLGVREEDGITWTGDQLVAAGYGPAPLAEVAAYDLATDMWSPVPPLPLGNTWATPLWTGQEVLFVTTSRPSLDVPAPDDGTVRNAALVPADGCWWLPDTIPPPNSATYEGLWADGLALFIGRRGMAYDPGADRWLRMPPSGSAVRSDAAAAWAGDRLFLWGGRRGEATPARPRQDGTVFVPDAPRS